MSEPIRYRVANNQAQMTLGGNILAVDPAGPLVEYSDYARLKAEVERFKFTLEEERQITRQDWAGLRCEHDRVKRALEQAEAEVERLRKAGDAMARIIAPPTHGTGEWDGEWDAWNAAKEGKQS